jgi:CheY-like chemotaxis protein
MLLENKKIFVVEDNARNRIIFNILLSKHGAVVEFDSWGGDALWRLKDYSVDLIILDLMLFAGISGYTIYEQLRNLPAHAKTPIVAVSAADPSVAIPKTKKMGFAGFIAKPIDDELFPNQLVRILTGECVWDTGIRV